MKTRRKFLGEASCAAVSSIPLLNTLLNLRLSGSVAAATTPGTGEYRALVCLFFSGGIDSYNLLVPTDTAGFAQYSASRGSAIALTAGQLAALTPDNTGGRTFGTHGAMTRLAGLFNQGRAAFVSNVGTLVEPVQNRAQVNLNQKRLPLGLYSHSDQIEQWQTSVPHSRSGTGWAGKMADLIRDLNANQAVSMNVSLDGSNVWQTGVNGAEYAVSPGNNQDSTSGGAIPLTGYDVAYNANELRAPTSAAIDSQLALQYSDLLSQTHQKKRRDALEAFAIYDTATKASPLPAAVDAAFPRSPLGLQLRQVARTLAARTGLGACRQTFFVNRGGWDHHSDVLANMNGMLPEIDAAIGAFYDALTALGLTNNVTLFTASDFGRTLTSNGRGSDHAWAGNHFVIGGAVKGKKIHGTFPSLAVNPDTGPELNPLDTGRGRLIPTTSCDQYFAELALWLGVPKSSLPLILPNIGNFYSTTSSAPPVGFLL